MPTERFMCASIVSVFITLNACSPKVDLCLGIVRWRRICDGHRICYGTLLDNHPFDLWQLDDSWAQVRTPSFLWLYWCCAQNQRNELQRPGERELLPENPVKSWYQYNGGVYGKKASICNIQRALQTRAAAGVQNQKFRCGNVAGILPESEVTGNLNLFDFISQVLRCQGVDKGKSMYFKASDLCLVNTT